MATKRNEQLARNIRRYVRDAVRSDRRIGVPDEMQTSDNSQPVTINPRNHINEIPPQLLAKILSYVGTKSFNPPPPQYLHYLTANSEKYLKMKSGSFRFFLPEENSVWYLKKEEYAVRNLLSLKRVCSHFENVIENMTPEKEYDTVMVDLKLQGCEDSSAVTMYKYGGTGAIKPATHLARNSRFSADTHLAKFERIRNIIIADMELSEGVFEKILEMDLGHLKQLSFERWRAVTMENGRDYLKRFKASLPENVVLEPYKLKRLLVNSNYLYCFKQHERNRNLLKVRCRQERREFRNFRTINTIHNILRSKTHRKHIKHAYREKTIKYKKDLRRFLFSKLGKGKSREIQECGKFHFKKCYQMLQKTMPKSQRTLVFHLKMLKMISSKKPMSLAEEQGIIQQVAEMKKRESQLHN
ncbi:hypothetical protein L5515_002809 [Caenorhabditis briggsae]|uniref:F-box domain-containing protein n=1 Tax=Caenorhabditis briggsae TaxID=6238 RepID=A0AAE9J5V2_CAEBR|nr:hypothetical protein L5515_002809 [Caenorhabditis briggsae]